MSEITVFLKQVFLGICGLSFGLLASAGVFTVLVSVGLIPRFAGKMHVAKKVFALEEAVVFGTLFGGFLSVFSSYGHLGGWILAKEPFGESTVLVWKWIGSAVLILWGFFAGMFVARRIGFRHGLGVAIAAAAFGKLLGSLLYFAKGIYMSGF